MAEDHRTPAEKTAWEKGAFTEEEAADMGLTVEEANAQRARDEAALGNPLVPPS